MIVSAQLEYGCVRSVRSDVEERHNSSSSREEVMNPDMILDSFSSSNHMMSCSLPPAQLRGG